MLFFGHGSVNLRHENTNCKLLLLQHNAVSVWKGIPLQHGCENLMTDKEPSRTHWSVSADTQPRIVASVFVFAWRQTFCCAGNQPVIVVFAWESVCIRCASEADLKHMNGVLCFVCRRYSSQHIASFSDSGSNDICYFRLCAFSKFPPSFLTGGVDRPAGRDDEVSRCFRAIYDFSFILRQGWGFLRVF